MLNVLLPARIAESTELIAAALGQPTYLAAFGFDPHASVDVTATLTPQRIERLQRCLDESVDGRAPTVAAATPRAAATQAVHDAIAWLDSVEPHTRAQVALLVGAIEIVNVVGCESGSSPDDPARFWVSVGAGHDVVALASSIRHELVHQALFVADMIGALFLPEADHAPPIVSAIRGIARPFRSAFHAAAVSGSLIDLYWATGQAARADQLLPPFARSVAELGEHRRLLASHGLDTLDQLTELASAIEPAGRFR